MLAGSVAIQATSGSRIPHDTSHKASSANGAVLDCIQPLSGWWMYNQEDPAKFEARKMEMEDIKAEMRALESTGKFQGNERCRWFDIHGRHYELNQY